MVKTADVLVRIKGDHKGLDTSVGKSKKSLSGLKGAAVAAGPAIAIAGVAAGAAFLAASVKMAAAEEAVTATTAAMLEKQGVMWSEVGKETDAYLKELEKLTTFNDTDLQEAFNAMLATGADYETAMASMETVTGLAAATGMDLAGAGKIVGRALNDDIEILGRYGIEATDGADAMKIMNERFGDGSQQADTFEGQMRNLKNQVSNVMEAIGSELLPVATDLMSILADGAMFVLPYVVKGFKILLLPIKALVHNLQMTKLALEAVWKGMKGDFEGAALLSDEMRKNQKEYNEELLNTAKDLFGIEREQDALNNTYITQAGLVEDVADEQAGLNDEIEAGTDAIDEQTKAITQSIEDMRSYAAALRRGYTPRTAKQAAAGETVGRTYSSQAEVAAARDRGEIKAGDTYSISGTGTANIISAPSDFVQGQGMGGVKPRDWSGGATINIGTVNESSAGAVAESINRLYRKATVLGPQ